MKRVNRNLREWLDPRWITGGWVVLWAGLALAVWKPPPPPPGVPPGPVVWAPSASPGGESTRYPVKYRPDPRINPFTASHVQRWLEAQTAHREAPPDPPPVPPESVPETDPAPPALPPVILQYQGSLSTPGGGRQALVKLGEAPAVFMAAGETLAGYTLAEIAPRRLVLEAAGRVVEVPRGVPMELERVEAAGHE